MIQGRVGHRNMVPPGFRSARGISVGMNRSFVTHTLMYMRRGVQTNGFRLYSTGAAKPPKKRWLLRIFGATIAVAGTGYVYDQTCNSATISRSVYALSVFGYAAYKYYHISKAKDPELVDEHVSEIIYQMLMRNKGMYIKLGQAIANQGSIFPMAYQKRFVKLYDDAPVDSWEIVDKMLKDSYGDDYESRVFAHIDKVPVASALIAQVHRAQLKNGDDVAVKVQHHYIQSQVAADMWCYQLVVKMYEWVFDIPMSFYAKYVSDQTILETKFVHELENAEKLRAFLQDDKDMRNLGVYVPRNYADLTNDRVLVSEWITGTPLTDKRVLIDSKYDLSKVMHQFITLFGKMIFRYGFVHCDPHPGNLLVRIHHGKQQLVVLDHGLYVQMPEKFRKEYAQFWRYMAAFDFGGIKSISQEWGVSSTDMLVSSVQMKPPNMDPQQKQKKAKDLMKEFLSDSSKFPLDLFFLGRAMRIIQTCNKNLGSPVNRFNSLTNSAVNVLIDRSTWYDYFILVRLKLTLFVSTILFWIYRARQIWKGDRYGFKGLGIEDEIERQMKKMVQSMGMDMLVEDEIK